MAKGTKDDPIEISDPSEARANLSYVIKPKKEKADGKPLPVGSRKDRSEG
jgi:hypothetical protein